MSTRGAITRIKGDGFEGRYHHFDAYPDGLGQALIELAQGHFRGDVKAMLKVLIDEHPAGWSNIIGCDFNLKAGYGLADKHPACYCHGERSEEAQIVTDLNASDCGCEYVYAFDEERKTMAVLSSYNEDGSKMIGMFGSGNPDAKWYVKQVVDLTKETVLVDG